MMNLHHRQLTPDVVDCFDTMPDGEEFDIKELSWGFKDTTLLQNWEPIPGKKRTATKERKFRGKYT